MRMMKTCERRRGEGVRDRVHYLSLSPAAAFTTHDVLLAVRLPRDAESADVDEDALLLGLLR
jgi:hypothetical protein